MRLVVRKSLVLTGVPDAVQREEYPYEAAGEYMGIPVLIETLKGNIRRGKTWAVRMPAHYGEFPGTKGSDADPVDVFIGPIPYCDRIFVIQSKTPAGEYDEDKVMLGFVDEQSAIACYRASYTIEMPAPQVLSYTWAEFLHLFCDRSDSGIMPGVPFSKARRT